MATWSFQTGSKADWIYHIPALVEGAHGLVAELGPVARGNEDRNGFHGMECVATHCERNRLPRRIQIKLGGREVRAPSAWENKARHQLNQPISFWID